MNTTYDNDDEIMLQTGFAPFDDLVGPFMPGEVHLMVGRTDLTTALINRLIADAAVKGMHAYYIDGGNRADPFAMAGILRMHREDPRVTLQKVMIARAFTAYQMDTLINVNLAELPEAPPLLIVSSIDSLFSDPDVDAEAARGMLKNCMNSISAAASRGSCIVITASGGSRGGDLLPIITPHCSVWVSLRNRQRGMVRIITKGGRWMDLSMVHPLQTMIDDFGSVPLTTEAV